MIIWISGDFGAGKTQITFKLNTSLKFYQPISLCKKYIY